MSAIATGCKQKKGDSRLRQTDWRLGAKGFNCHGDSVAVDSCAPRTISIEMLEQPSEAGFSRILRDFWE
jgi:hypothetical protein